ncbi:AMP-binding protein, partial [Pseudozobellia sp. WGM2]|uniref:AMP-binding protein n=1 Tax=Pseudozobellia sp. WGM2 TaxID=2787625 RepID=UPI001ADFB598
NTRNKANRDSLAYVIYTSGSTGKPKGVMIENKSLFDSTVSRINIYYKNAKFLLLSSISFDSSIAGIFGTICSSGELNLISKNNLENPKYVASYISKKNINQLLSVPTYFKILIVELSKIENSLQQVILAGEYSHTSLILEIHKTETFNNCNVYNEYGPSECCVWSSFYKYRRSLTIPSTIGSPIWNTQIYILDSDHNLLPKGVAGEICISGDGLARGYLNR